MYYVTTPEHGGILEGKRKAISYLSPAAIDLGESYGMFLAYEEDILMDVVLYEHPEVQDQLRFVTDTSGGKAVATRSELWESAFLKLAKYLPDYVAAHREWEWKIFQLLTFEEWQERNRQMFGDENAPCRHSAT